MQLRPLTCASQYQGRPSGWAAVLPQRGTSSSIRSSRSGLVRRQGPARRSMVRNRRKTASHLVFAGSFYQRLRRIWHTGNHPSVQKVVRNAITAPYLRIAACRETERVGLSFPAKRKFIRDAVIRQGRARSGMMPHCRKSPLRGGEYAHF